MPRGASSNTAAKRSLVSSWCCDLPTASLRWSGWCDRIGPCSPLSHYRPSECRDDSAAVRTVRGARTAPGAAPTLLGLYLLLGSSFSLLASSSLLLLGR